MTEHDVRAIENAWIPMRDGTRLAAKIWLPESAEREPVPAVLEYIPYRKRDHKARRDAQNHGFFAQCGYAGVRVDLRGSGDSDGVLRGEYLQQELDDGLEVIEWIASQPWCSGKVGLFGLSWGGFNGLQLAARRPDALGAVVSVCSSDDRYADDVHHMGGCLLTDNLSWASTMFAFNSCPPDPEIVGERWRDMWLERLEHSGLWLLEWLKHQRRDAFWKHGSVCEDYDAIQAPVMAVSGWADGYSNSVLRLLEHLSVPTRGIVGPWGHKFPHMGGPGPTIDFLGLCVRWWDRWLKGIRNGVEEEPALLAWMLDPSDPLLPRSPGRWVAEQTWPSPAIERRPLRLIGNTLRSEESADRCDPTTLSILSPLSVGMFAGKWCSYAEVTDLPWDQREEDGGALVFDSAPLGEDLEILGRPEVELELSVDKPVAMVAVRLIDVATDDRATRVTFGVLNLTHRESREHPEPLVPGERYRVRVRMNEIAQRFARGNRIRLSISTSYWPLVWPAPEPARLTLYADASRLLLPERRRGATVDLPDLGGPRAAPEPPATLLAPAHREWTVRHNLATNEVTLQVHNNDALIRLDETGTTIGRTVREDFSSKAGRYETLRAEAFQERRFERGDWRILTTTRTILTSTRTHFIVHATLDAYEDDARVFSKSWNESIPRDMV